MEEKRGWDGDAGRLHTTSSKEQLGSTEADLPQEKISQVSVSTCSSMLRGGKIKHFMHEWTKYNSDPFILSCVNGCKLFFLTQPSRDKLPHPIKLCKKQQLALSNMLCEFVADGIIKKCEREKEDFVSTVFLREKRTFTDTSKKYRMILNVKQLNIYVEYVHFKMDTLDSCLNLMDPDCYMASIDLENAYHSVPIHPDYTKFFKFLASCLKAIETVREYSQN